ncbi:MAG: hypothetical protein PHQ43_11370, partial [Dehalococcoidales bacterium]|nr:hypothetical protein [Dehalococcoidales bacterium]
MKNHLAALCGFFIALMAVPVWPADVEITDLGSLTEPATGDILLVIDVSDTSMDSDGTAKQLTIGDLVSALDIGDVSGPGSSTDGYIPLWSGTGGDTLAAGIANNSSNWNTAYGWGDHSTQNYLDGDTDVQATLASSSTQVPSANAVINYCAGLSFGNVFGPAVHADSYVPQWDGANSKTLKQGYATELSLTLNPAVLPTSFAVKTALNTEVATLEAADDTLQGNIDNAEAIASSYACGAIKVEETYTCASAHDECIHGYRPIVGDYIYFVAREFDETATNYYIHKVNMYDFTDYSTQALAYATYGFPSDLFYSATKGKLYITFGRDGATGGDKIVEVNPSTLALTTVVSGISPTISTPGMWIDDDSQYLYVVGYDSGGTNYVLQYDMSTWTLRDSYSTASPAGARYLHGVTAYGNYVYAICGGYGHDTWIIRLSKSTLDLVNLGGDGGSKVYTDLIGGAHQLIYHDGYIWTSLHGYLNSGGDPAGIVKINASDFDDYTKITPESRFRGGMMGVTYDRGYIWATSMGSKPGGIIRVDPDSLDVVEYAFPGAYADSPPFSGSYFYANGPPTFNDRGQGFTSFMPSYYEDTDEAAYMLRWNLSEGYKPYDNQDIVIIDEEAPFLMLRDNYRLIEDETVTITASTNTIAAASGTPFSALYAGQTIELVGSTEDNDGVYTIASIGGGGSSIVTTEDLADDDTSEPVDIRARQDKRVFIQANDDVVWMGGYTGTADEATDVNLKLIAGNSFTPRITIDGATGGVSFTSGASITEFSTDGTMADNSDTAVPTEKAVKTYVQAILSSEISEGDSNVEVIDTGTGQVDFDLDGALAMRLNSNGLNVGGVPTYSSSYVDLYLAHNLMMQKDAVITTNSFWDGSNVRYSETGYGGAMQFLTGGGFRLYVYPNGTENTTISGIVTALNIDTSGNLGLPAALTVGDSLTLSTGATVDTIETSLTNDDTHLPTSGAVSDAVANSSNWDTAYTDRLKWDGGSTGLTAATGRTSLGLSGTSPPSGAYYIGTYDEFANSSSANVQDVLDDLDAAITSAAADDDIISEGNSNVEVIDTGTGQIDFDLDGTLAMRLNSNGLNIGGVPTYSSPYVDLYVAHNQMMQKDAVITTNGFWDGSNVKYCETGYGGAMQFLTGGGFKLFVYPGGTANANISGIVTALDIDTSGNLTLPAALDVTGALSKGSGSFKITHPLDDSKWLYHSFIEGPKADLIYRGKVTLVDGKAAVDLDAASNMTPGT